MEKANRLDAIRAILAEKQSATQHELLSELAEAGYVISQPTLSADLKKLRAAKMQTRNGYKYVLPAQAEYRRTIDAASLPVSLQLAGIEEHVFSSSTLVLTTKAGYASALAAEIDGRKFPEVAGTIAGTDTLFVAIREGADREALTEKLRSLFPTLANG